MPAEPIQSANIAAKIAQPCRWLPTSRPNAYVSANGIARSASIWKKFVNGVGFSNGCAELAFAGPPPFVPSSLIASWLATGPRQIVWVAPWTVVACAGPRSDCTTPWLAKRSASTIESGSRTRVVVRVRSAQKFPIVSERRRTRPRTSAIATAIPTAADAKFCTVSPAICVRWLIVDSPP